MSTKTSKEIINNMIANGVPASIDVRFSGKVDWKLHNTVLRQPSVTLVAPYVKPGKFDHDDVHATAFSAIWGALQSFTSDITPVAYDGLSNHDHYVKVANELLVALVQSTLMRPYETTHIETKDGVTVTAELRFKP